MLLEVVRSIYGDETEILLVYNDLPTNDYASLIQNQCGMYFIRLHGNISVT